MNELLLRRRVAKTNALIPLPEGYVNVEYINIPSWGTYFVSNVYPNQDTSIKIRFRLSSPPQMYPFLFSAHEKQTLKEFAFVAYNNNTSDRIRFGNIQGVFGYTTGWHTVEIKNKIGYFDGTPYDFSNVEDFTSPVKLIIGTGYANEGTSIPTSRYFFFTGNIEPIELNGHKLVPCQKTSDNKYHIWDATAGEFFQRVG